MTTATTAPIRYYLCLGVAQPTYFQVAVYAQCTSVDEVTADVEAIRRVQPEVANCVRFCVWDQLEGSWWLVTPAHPWERAQLHEPFRVCSAGVLAGRCRCTHCRAYPSEIQSVPFWAYLATCYTRQAAA